MGYYRSQLSPSECKRCQITTNIHKSLLHDSKRVACIVQMFPDVISTRQGHEKCLVLVFLRKRKTAIQKCCFGQAARGGIVSYLMCIGNLFG